MLKVFLCVTTRHDLWLVGLAAAICAQSTVATFFLYAKAPVFPLWRRSAWLMIAGFVAGSGIWTTHFIAMLAFKTGLPTGYSPLPTLGSLGVAVLSVTLGLATASLQSLERSRANVLLGGELVGLGVTLMHYVGMTGYRTAGVLTWDLRYVAASVVLGAVFAALALWTARARRGFWGQAAAGVLLSLGVVGMHFTGMTAVAIIPNPDIAVPASLMSDQAMIIAAVTVAALVLVAAMAGVAFDALGRNAALTHLRTALDAMPEGVALYDAGDRLAAWNGPFERLCAASGVALVPGMRFEDLLDAQLRAGAFPIAEGREGAWRAERRAAHSRGTSGLTQQTSTGRWVRTTETRTGDGGVVSVSVDVTELKEAEAAMSQARDRAEELARRAETAESIAGLGHWRLDAKTRDLQWSAELYRIFGLEPSQPVTLEESLARYHPEDRAEVAERLERQLAAGTLEDVVTLRIVRDTGEVRYLEGSSRCERSGDGSVREVVGTVLDVTERKLADLAIAQSEERFRRLALNVADIIVESDADGRLTYVSPASLAVVGFAPEELIGQRISSLMRPEDAQKVLDMCQRVFDADGALAPWPVEFVGRHKDGSEIWLECKPTVTRDASTGRYRVTDVIRDISERKALEGRLREAQAQAEAALLAKSDFLANMSHELRTPLTSIIGFTSLASEQKGIPPLTRTYLQRVAEASQALLCVVNDVLDFSKLEAGQVVLQPEPVNLARLCNSTLDLFAPQAGAKDLQLSFECGAPQDLILMVDPDRVRQVLLNLVGNAVKFTASGSITLSASYDREASTLTVAVTDTGPGIAEDKFASLFQRFSQIDGSMTRAAGGTGLGLAICKGLIEAMGGRIGIESRLGEGSRFWFTIPAQTASFAPSRDDRVAVAWPCFPGMRVLVVDDHAANRELARLFLLGIGAQVSEAVDGREAVDWAFNHPFDVILMDIQMPRLDGRQALREIRGRANLNDRTPVLAFTANADQVAVARLLAEGFHSVVAKPVTPEALIAAVSEATAFDLPFADGPAEAAYDALAS